MTKETGGEKAGAGLQEEAQQAKQQAEEQAETGRGKVWPGEQDGGTNAPCRWEITAEELDAVLVEPGTAAGAAKHSSPWEITGAELDDIRQALIFTAEELDAVRPRLELFPEELDAAGAVKGSFPPEQGELPSQKIPSKPESFKAKMRGLIPTNLWQMAVAGLCGAVLAWLVDECLFPDHYTYGSFMEMVLGMAWWGCLISGIIGFSFGTVESLLNRQYGLALRKGFRWMLGAALGGFIGSGAGQMLYSLLGGGGIGQPLLWQIIARTLGWTLLGAGMGMANGWMAGNKKRMVNGLIGGMAGGAAGGLVFDLICIPLPYGEGSVARLVGFLALGGGIGALIGLVEHFRREVWLAAVSGPMQGKEFILFGARTVFGSSGKADIVLYGDASVPPYAFRVDVINDSSYRGTDLTGRGMVMHNNHSAQRFTLRNGDLIGIGKHLLQFRVKEG